MGAIHPASRRGREVVGGKRGGPFPSREVGEKGRRASRPLPPPVFFLAYFPPCVERPPSPSTSETTSPRPRPLPPRQDLDRPGVLVLIDVKRLAVGFQLGDGFGDGHRAHSQPDPLGLRRAGLLLPILRRHADRGERLLAVGDLLFVLDDLPVDL